MPAVQRFRCNNRAQTARHVGSCFAVASWFSGHGIQRLVKVKIHWLGLHLAYGVSMAGTHFSQPPPAAGTATLINVVVSLPIRCGRPENSAFQYEHWVGSAHRWSYLYFDESLPNFDRHRNAGCTKMLSISVLSALCQLRRASFSSASRE